MDLRSLAAFRIALAAVVVSDSVVALTNAEAFYSDTGVLPRTALAEQWGGQMMWSLHALSGSLTWQVVLIVMQLMAAVSLLAGHRTRVATLVCWALVASLDARNPMINNGADSMIRLLLFWSVFLPLGARWSLDARRDAKQGGSGAPHPGSTLVSLPAACLLLQVAFVYWFSVAFKNHGVWWSEGTALRQVLELDSLARPAAVWLREYPAACRALTHFTVILEILGPVVAFLPVWRAGCRFIAVLAMVGLHAGIAICLDIGAFPWVMMAAWLAFLPSEFWRRFIRDKHVNIPKNENIRCDYHVGKRDIVFGFVLNGFCVFSLSMVFLWNLRGTNFAFWEKVFPRWANPAAMVFRLDQYWTMFAPTPLMEDGWFVLRAGLSDGSEVDLLRDGAPVSWDKPALASAAYKDARWQKYQTNLWMTIHQVHRMPYGDYVARRWNDSHGGLSQVVAWQLWFVREMTQPDGTRGKPEPILMAQREGHRQTPPPATSASPEQPFRE
ncbi:HTTM domain-containing protein [Roseimicrobium gellanilyticum]|uniref:HTTM domain-containing protein n=1 Tax=Roseimicrobium gellanilyticum TaxID=748857 RepID=UPI001472B832|nr:HTTM domain-containing protein [Roseimicrobium gellanilyticum]